MIMSFITQHKFICIMLSLVNLSIINNLLITLPPFRHISLPLPLYKLDQELNNRRKIIINNLE